MEKEKLLAFFQANYLSRQEVLFKLPLSYTIDAFWPELLNRRKAQAVLLPLYNASGMPYWYVLTQKMISASERLCEEAIAQDTGFDPYRAEMTSAMTEEMFFTSFVEGAPILLQDAMDFLSRGTEPENIQEQIIWNNRHAWSEMVNGIYRPLNEEFVRKIAFILTEEMDGCAEDYRQTDTHPIVAMNDETYGVPSAASLPARMKDYYDFLQAPNVHPLIKAAVAQAYLLVSRPFPEGNERLSRMMSSAVLLRCGYDFFRDISISSVIARENYRYYKSMCEIIRPENGGDMTYFMEYYLELLVRALEDRKERLRRREQDDLSKERELARVPLSRQPSERKDTTVQEMPREMHEESTEIKSEEVSKQLPSKEFLARVESLKDAHFQPAVKSIETIHSMVRSGKHSFTAKEWAKQMDLGYKNAYSQLTALCEKGIVRKIENLRPIMYTFQLSAEQKGPGANTPEHSFLQFVDYYERSVDPAKKRIAQFFRSLAQCETKTFTSRELSEQTGISLESSRGICGLMARAKAIVNTTPSSSPFVFRIPDVTVPMPEVKHDTEMPMDFWGILRQMCNDSSTLVLVTGRAIINCLKNGIARFTKAEWLSLTGLDRDQCEASCELMLEKSLITDHAPEGWPPNYVFRVTNKDFFRHPSEQLLQRLQKMSADHSSERSQRIAKFILRMIEQKRIIVRSSEWEKAFGVTSDVFESDLKLAVNLGLIQKNQFSAGEPCIYSLCLDDGERTRATDLTENQKDLVSKVFQAFGKEKFTVEKVAKLVGISISKAHFHLETLVQCGIVSLQQKPGSRNLYTLMVTPETYPECFLEHNEGKQPCQPQQAAV